MKIYDKIYRTTKQRERRYKIKMRELTGYYILPRDLEEKYIFNDDDLEYIKVLNTNLYLTK